MKINFLQKWYTRIIGIYFILIIISLIIDFTQYGYRLETWHKVFHIIIGIVVLFNWNNKKFYKPFCLINGIFFTLVALFGVTFPNFANLDAFNSTDTLLHAIVGITGLIISFFKR